jgi:hypothetical protein
MGFRGREIAVILAGKVDSARGEMIRDQRPVFDWDFGAVAPQERSRCHCLLWGGAPPAGEALVANETATEAVTQEKIALHFFCLFARFGWRLWGTILFASLSNIA